MFSFPEKFFELPNDLTLWQLLNSQFLATTVSALVAILVAIYGRKAFDEFSKAAAEQGASSAAQQARVLEAEQAQLQQQPAADEVPEVRVGRDHREDARRLIEQAKSFLEQVAEKDSDGRHRRTYEAINRYDYVPLAVALNTRGQINAKQLGGAVSAFSEWKRFERGRASTNAVPEATYAKITAAVNDLKGSQI